MHLVGVLSDFHNESLHHPIEPAMVKYQYSGLTHLIVDVKESDQAAALDYISSVFKDSLPNYSFSFFFLDLKLNELYNSDIEILETLLLLALVAFALAVAGVYNYSVYFTLNRLRQVAIRKILGATACDIVVMNVSALSKSIALSLFVALPVVYGVYNFWISQYAFRADVPLLQVTLPVIAMYVLTCIMVSRETLKTAGMKPAIAIQNLQQ